MLWELPLEVPVHRTRLVCRSQKNPSSLRDYFEVYTDPLCAPLCSLWFQQSSTETHVLTKIVVMQHALDAVLEVSHMKIDQEPELFAADA
jgi:hypothetical protein